MTGNAIARPLEPRNWWAVPLFLMAWIVLGCGFLDAQIRMDLLNAGKGKGFRLLYLPNGKYLKMVSLGFSPLLADLIYLWSIQYFSDPGSIQKREYLEHIYGSVIAELDPHYLDPYLTGALIMAMEMGEVEMALRLLDRGMKNNPDSWILAADAGFYAYLQLKDFQRAESYFQRALEIEGAPPILSRLRAGMMEKRGAKKDAYLTWLEIYETSQDDYIRNVSFRHVHDLKIEIDLEQLQNTIAIYRERVGEFPDRLDRLVESGWMKSLPTDPRELPYLYDPGTGRVSCATPFALKRGI